MKGDENNLQMVITNTPARYENIKLNIIKILYTYYIIKSKAVNKDQTELKIHSKLTAQQWKNEIKKQLFKLSTSTILSVEY